MNLFSKSNYQSVIAWLIITISAGMIMANPTLTAGTWVNISPSFVNWGNGPFTQGMAIDPNDPSTIYLCASAFDPSTVGLYKTTDAGSNWKKIGNLDEPIRLRIDPKNSQHLYCGDGVRGGTMGFFVSNDGGNTWTCPQSFKDLGTSISAFLYDVYDVAVDPTDFNHVLVSFHAAWGWTDSKWNMNAGVLESKDGGNTWIVHEPGNWGYGHSINFLYDPATGQGNSQTWMLGTQGGGFFRTTNSGASWTQVNTTGIQHGGGTIYYTKTGVLYASGGDKNLRSTNNGLTWTAIGNGGGYNCIYGDGTRLYTMKCFGPAKMQTSLESDGNTWANFNNQDFSSGPFEMGLDKVNGILYTASWGDGIWALKLPTTGINKDLSVNNSAHISSSNHSYKMIIRGDLQRNDGVNSTGIFDIRGRIASRMSISSQAFIIK